MNTTKFDESVLQTSLNIMNSPNDAIQTTSSIKSSSIVTSPYRPYSSQTLVSEIGNDLIQKTKDALMYQENASSNQVQHYTQEQSNKEEYCDLVIGRTMQPLNISTEGTYENHVITSHKSHFKNRNDTMKNESSKATKHVKFTSQEDEYLLKGIKKYGKKNWASIFKDNAYTFHESRTRDSLRMRSESVTFKKLLKM